VVWRDRKVSPNRPLQHQSALLPERESTTPNSGKSHWLLASYADRPFHTLSAHTFFQRARILNLKKLRRLTTHPHGSSQRLLLARISVPSQCHAQSKWMQCRLEHVARMYGRYIPLQGIPARRCLQLQAPALVMGDISDGANLDMLKCR
jgi:hypothetical protein